MRSRKLDEGECGILDLRSAHAVREAFEINLCWQGWRLESKYLLRTERGVARRSHQAVELM